MPPENNDSLRPIRGEIYLLVNDPRVGHLKNVPIKIQDTMALAPTESSIYIQTVEFAFDVHKSINLPFCDLARRFNCDPSAMSELENHLRSTVTSLYENPETKSGKFKTEPYDNSGCDATKSWAEENMPKKSVKSGERSVNYKENRG